MLNVLFFIEPAFELENPSFKANFFDQRIAPMADTLKAAYGQNVTIKAIVNDAIAVTCISPHVDLVIFKQSDLYDLMREDPLQYRIGFFSQALSHTLQFGYASKIKAKLKGFIPDVIIAFNNANYMRSVFPNSLILHSELGFFNRTPFPESWFFDPIAAGGSAWLNTYWESAQKEWKPNIVELESSNNIINCYKDLIHNNNPIKENVEKIQSRYSSLNLLTLQLNHQPYFDGYLPIRSQLQLAIGVLDKTPPDEGLIITEHPVESLSADARNYLKSTYPQYVPLPENTMKGGTSQFFMPFCKTIISPACTVAALKLFWGNGLISLTNQYLPQIADSHSIDIPWPKKSSLNKKQNLHIFSWMIHRFLNVDEQRKNPEWLERFINTGLEIQKTGNFINFYNETGWETAEQRAEIWLTKMNTSKQSAYQSHVIAKFINAFHKGDENYMISNSEEIMTIANAMPDKDERMDIHIILAFFYRTILNQYDLSIQYFEGAAEIAKRLIAVETSPHRIYRFYDGLFHIAYFAQAINDINQVRAAIAEMEAAQVNYGPIPKYFKDRIASEIKL